MLDSKRVRKKHDECMRRKLLWNFLQGFGNPSFWYWQKCKSNFVWSQQNLFLSPNSKFFPADILQHQLETSFEQDKQLKTEKLKN